LQRLLTYAESSGESVYVDDGASRTSTVHVDDVISLVRTALASSLDGSTYVAASDEVVTWREVAVAVASTTRGPCRLRSVTVAEAAAAGLDAATMAMSTVVRDRSAVRRLGWSAVGPELVTDL
jgi:nucleoside-diphosphate-sugar epimerase